MTIIRKNLLRSTAVMVALSPLATQQLYAATVSVPAQATIGSAVALTLNDPINFGTLTQTAVGGITKLGFTDNLTPVVPGLLPTGGTPTSGNITLKLTPGMQTKVTATATAFKITALGGGASSKSMTVSNVNYRVGTKTGPSLTFTPLGATNVLDVGANLKANAAQVQGVYQGNIKVIVNQF